MDAIKSFFSQLFTSLNTEDSIAVLVFLGVSFLLGLLFGAWSRAGKIRRLKRELETQERELKTLRTQYDSLVEQYEQKEADLKKAEAQVIEMGGDVNRLTNERMHYKTELDSARQLLEQLQTENLEYASRLENVTPVVSDETTVNGNVGTVTDEIYADRFEAIEEKLEKLVLENANLKEEISSLEEKANAMPPVIIAPPTTTTTTTSTSTSSDTGATTTGSTEPVLDLSDTAVDEEMPVDFEDEVLKEDYGDLSPQERAERAKASITKALGTKIPRASMAEKNDLQKIDGIGPFIEMKLNDIGIYTYKQISQLDDELIGHVTNAIQFFPGRIQKDNWVGQAKKLA